MAVVVKHNSIVGYIQELKKANFTDAQAEAVAKILEQQAESQEEAIQAQQIEIEALKAKEPATKGDIRESELRLQKEIEILRGELKTDIKNLEIKMMALYGGGFLILLGVLAKGFHWL